MAYRAIGIWRLLASVVLFRHNANQDEACKRNRPVCPVFISGHIGLGGTGLATRERDLQLITGSNGLSDLQSKFVIAYLEGKSPGDAAVAAGYSNPLSGYANLRLPHIVAIIHAETARQIANAAPAAFSVLKALVHDTKVAPKVRADIAHRMLVMAGHGAKASSGADLDDKTLTEMTREQLLEHVERARQAIDKLQDELSKRATPVDSTQDSAQDEAKLLDALA